MIRDGASVGASPLPRELHWNKEGGGGERGKEEEEEGESGRSPLDAGASSTTACDHGWSLLIGKCASDEIDIHKSGPVHLIEAVTCMGLILPYERRVRLPTVFRQEANKVLR